MIEDEILDEEYCRKDINNSFKNLINTLRVVLITVVLISFMLIYVIDILSNRAVFSMFDRLSVITFLVVIMAVNLYGIALGIKLLIVKNKPRIKYAITMMFNLFIAFVHLEYVSKDFMKLISDYTIVGQIIDRILLL